MADLEPKEVHEKRIADKKAANLERGRQHYAAQGRLESDQKMPHEKVAHRLTTVEPKE